MKTLKRIILIRHGETEGNVNPEVYIKTKDKDVSLTAHGLDQAFQCGLKLKDELGDKKVIFYVSPFKRARDTLAEIVKSISPKLIIEDSRIHEKKWEVFDSKEGMDAFTKSEHFKDYFFRKNDSESISDLQNRVNSFLEGLLVKDQSDLLTEDVVIVCHWWVIVAMHLYLYNKPYEEFHNIKVKNAEPIIIEIDKTIFSK